MLKRVEACDLSSNQVVFFKNKCRKIESVNVDDGISLSVGVKFFEDEETYFFGEGDYLMVMEIEVLTTSERFYLKNEMLEDSVQECDLKVGNIVTFTNEAGVKFRNLMVVGFSKPENAINQRFIHISTDSPWFPVSRESLELQSAIDEESDEDEFNPRKGYVGNIFEVTYPDGEVVRFKAETWKEGVENIGTHAIKLEVVGEYEIGEDDEEDTE